MRKPPIIIDIISVSVVFFYFISDHTLTEHENFCREHEPTRVEMPAPGSTIKFKTDPSFLKANVVFVADFESFLVPVSEPRGQKSTNIQRHDIASYYYKICCSDSTSTELQLYKGDNPAQHFLESLRDDLEKNDNRLNQDLPRNRLTPQETFDFEQSQECPMW